MARMPSVSNFTTLDNNAPELKRNLNRLRNAMETQHSIREDTYAKKYKKQIAAEKAASAAPWSRDAQGNIMIWNGKDWVPK